MTTGYLAREVLDGGQVWARDPCPVLGEPLVYAFYGRSAFRNRADADPSDLAFQFPVVLVIDPANAPSPKHLFAFDSGAFVNGYMDDYLDPGMPLFDFCAPPDVASAAALAEYFFGGSLGFLRNRLGTVPPIPAGNFEATSYSRMLQPGGRGSNRLDDRVSTPELIFAEPIPLVEAVRAAVLPDVLAGDPDIGGRFRALGIEVREYMWQGDSRPSEYHMLIRGLVEELYSTLGWYP